MHAWATSPTIQQTTATNIPCTHTSKCVCICVEPCYACGVLSSVRLLPVQGRQRQCSFGGQIKNATANDRWEQRHKQTNIHNRKRRRHTNDGRRRQLIWINRTRVRMIQSVSTVTDQREVSKFCCCMDSVPNNVVCSCVTSSSFLLVSIIQVHG